MMNARSLSDAARLIEIQRELLANVPHVVPEIIDQEGAAFDIRQQVMNATGGDAKDAVRPSARGHVPSRQPRLVIGTKSLAAPLLAETRDLRFVETIAGRHGKQPGAMFPMQPITRRAQA